MNAMMKVIILFFIFLQHVCSQNYEDILDRLFKKSFTHENLDYSDYNCGCGFPYPCPDVRDYYDIPNDDSNIEVVYVDPDQVKTIYDIILNRRNHFYTTPRNNDGSIDEVTTQRTVTPESTESSVEYTEAQYKPTSTAHEELTTKILDEQVDDDDDQLPVEDVENSKWRGSNSEEKKENEEESGNSATPYSLEISSTSSPNEEEVEQSENTENEYNYDDQARDSEEDRLSVKRVEDDPSNRTDEEILEEDNNSEPADVDSWINN